MATWVADRRRLAYRIHGTVQDFIFFFTSGKSLVYTGGACGVGCRAIGAVLALVSLSGAGSVLVALSCPWFGVVGHFHQPTIQTEARSRGSAVMPPDQKVPSSDPRWGICDNEPASRKR